MNFQKKSPSPGLIATAEWENIVNPPILIVRISPCCESPENDTDIEVSNNLPTQFFLSVLSKDAPQDNHTAKTRNLFHIF